MVLLKEKGINMRVKKLCYNCSFDTILNYNSDQCPVCGNKLETIGYLMGKKLVNMNDDQRTQWIEDKAGHKISDDLKVQLRTYYDQRHIEIDKEIEEFKQKQILEQQAKNIARMQKESDKQNCVPQCPICGSTNINKITLIKRATKTAVFGVLGAIDDAGKVWQCKNCGSKF